MTRCTAPAGSAIRTSTLWQFRIWHLAILVVYVAIAIVDIQDNRRTEPFLVALAAAGFAAYAVICWLAWHLMQRLERRLGFLPVVIAYLVAMAALFLAATVIYLMLEYAYLRGWRVSFREI